MLNRLYRSSLSHFDEDKPIKTVFISVSMSHSIPSNQNMTIKYQIISKKSNSQRNITKYKMNDWQTKPIF
jgi:hypothetical protein